MLPLFRRLQHLKFLSSFAVSTDFKELFIIYPAFIAVMAVGLGGWVG